MTDLPAFDWPLRFVGDDSRAGGTPLWVWACEPGDTFELTVTHDAGVSLNIEAATLTVVRLGNT